MACLRHLAQREAQDVCEHGLVEIKRWTDVKKKLFVGEESLEGDVVSMPSFVIFILILHNHKISYSRLEYLDCPKVQVAMFVFEWKVCTFQAVVKCSKD